MTTQLNSHSVLLAEPITASQDEGKRSVAAGVR